MYIVEEEVIFLGSLVCGVYIVWKRFIDDDGRVYLDLDYLFEIWKDW